MTLPFLPCVGNDLAFLGMFAGIEDLVVNTIFQNHI